LADFGHRFVSFRCSFELLIVFRLSTIGFPGHAPQRAPSPHLRDSQLRLLPPPVRIRPAHPGAHLVQSQVRGHVPQDAVLRVHVQCDAHLFAGIHENAAGGK